MAGVSLALALLLAFGGAALAFTYPDYGPYTKTWVTSSGGTPTVRVMFEPVANRVYYTVYKHTYTDGRVFNQVGATVYVLTYDPPTIVATADWGTTASGYVYYADTAINNYEEYYYFVKAGIDAWPQDVWPTDDVTGKVYPPLDRYTVARAFPPGQTVHGEFTPESAAGCANCHGLHSSVSKLTTSSYGKLLKATTQADLCGSCHDGSGSKYDEVLGRVRTSVSWSTYAANPAGPFGSQLKDGVGIPTMNSLHNVWRSGLTATSVYDAVYAWYWRAPGNTYGLSGTAPGQGDWSKAMICTACHEPHNRFRNFRLLRGDFDTDTYAFPVDGVYRTQVVVRGASGVNTTRKEAATVYLAGYSTGSATGAGITDFCTACHRKFMVYSEVYSGVYSGVYIQPGYDPYDPGYENVYDYDPSGTNVDNFTYDDLRTHGYKRHMLAMPAANATLHGRLRIIDPGRVDNGTQIRLSDWSGNNLPRYVPLEGRNDGINYGNSYADNKLVCLTCHVPHGTQRNAGGVGPGGETLDLENAYKNYKMNDTADTAGAWASNAMPGSANPCPTGTTKGFESSTNEVYCIGTETATGTVYDWGRNPVSGYLHNRKGGLIYGSSSVLARFEPFASVCWRCHSSS